MFNWKIIPLLPALDTVMQNTASLHFLTESEVDLAASENQMH